LLIIFRTWEQVESSLDVEGVGERMMEESSCLMELRHFSMSQSEKAEDVLGGFLPFLRLKEIIQWSDNDDGAFIVQFVTRFAEAAHLL